MARKISWTALKERQARLDLPFDWIEETDQYIVKIFTLNDDYETILDREEPTADTIDFETNFKTVPQTIGEANQRIKVSADISAASINGFPCPTVEGSKWRTEQSTTDVTLSTGSYTTLKTLANGTLTAFVLDFSSDRVDVKMEIDGQEIFDIDLDDLEDNQTSSSSSAAQAAGGAGIMFVKTGSKFCFNPPCGLKYTTLTISAKGESNNRKLSGYLLHYVVD